MMPNILYLLALVIILSGCSYTPHKEDVAPVMDMATTAYILESGIGREVNPLMAGVLSHPAGYVANVAVSLVFNNWMRTLDQHQCNIGIKAHTGVRLGAAVNNAMIIASVSNPFIYGIVATVWYWITAEKPCGP